MKEFEFFIASRTVKKQAPDLNTAKATAKDGLERLGMAKSIFGSQKPKYVLENSYEAIREIIDAILFVEGYKSYSHEASVAYLLKLGFPLSDVSRIDTLRKQRNGIKYYGEDATDEEARAALSVAERAIMELMRKHPDIIK